MKILTTIFDLKNLNNLSKHVDGFIIGNHQFGARLIKSFSFEELVLALAETKKLGKEFYLACNQMFNDEQLEQFKNWIQKFDLELLNGIVVADLGAYQVLNQLGYAKKTIYNPETLAANVYDFNFLADLGIKGVYIAKEITLEDIQFIGKNRKYQLFMVGHGHLNMFYSKRQLIDNFMNFNLEENIYHEEQNLTIVEENRLNEPFPIFEDLAGTHVFRSQVFSALGHLNDLNDIVDYLVIDTLFKDDQYAILVSPMYFNQLINPEKIEEIKVKYHEQWDEGFLYKKTVYKNKG